MARQQLDLFGKFRARGVDQTMGAKARALAGVFGQVGQTALGITEQRAIKEGQQEAARQSLGGDPLKQPEQRSEFTAKGRAYNVSSTDNFIKNVQADATQKVKDFSTKHSTNPGAFRDAMREYRGQILSGATDENKMLLGGAIDRAIGESATNIEINEFIAKQNKTLEDSSIEFNEAAADIIAKSFGDHKGLKEDLTDLGNKISKDMSPAVKRKFESFTNKLASLHSQKSKEEYKALGVSSKNIEIFTLAKSSFSNLADAYKGQPTVFAQVTTEYIEDLVKDLDAKQKIIVGLKLTQQAQGITDLMRAQTAEVAEKVAVKESLADIRGQADNLLADPNITNEEFQKRLEGIREGLTVKGKDNTALETEASEISIKAKNVIQGRIDKIQRDGIVDGKGREFKTLANSYLEAKESGKEEEAAEIFMEIEGINNEGFLNENDFKSSVLALGSQGEVSHYVGKIKNIIDSEDDPSDKSIAIELLKDEVNSSELTIEQKERLVTRATTEVNSKNKQTAIIENQVRKDNIDKFDRILLDAEDYTQASTVLVKADMLLDEKKINGAQRRQIKNVMDKAKRKDDVFSSLETEALLVKGGELPKEWYSMGVAQKRTWIKTEKSKIAEEIKRLNKEARLLKADKKTFAKSEELIHKRFLAYEGREDKMQEEMDKLDKKRQVLLDKYSKKQAAITSIGDSLYGDQGVSKANSNKYYLEKVVNKMPSDTKDPMYWGARFDYVKQTRDVPKSMTDEIKAGLGSNDAETMLYAAGLVNEINEIENLPVNVVSNEHKIMAARITSLSSYQTPEEIKRTLSTMDRSKLGSQLNEIVKDYSKTSKGIYQRIFEENVPTEWFRWDGMNPTEEASLKADGKALFDSFMLAGANEDEARELVKTEIKKTWGVDSFTGNGMKNPISRWYSSIPEEEFKLESVSSAKEMLGNLGYDSTGINFDNIQITSDIETSELANAGQLPTYRMMINHPTEGPIWIPGRYRPASRSRLEDIAKGQAERRKAESVSASIKAKNEEDVRRLKRFEQFGRP